MCRHPKFTNAEELEKEIEKYFIECEVKAKHPTISGLCVFLGVYRDYIAELGKKPEFSDTIKKTRQRLEAHIEQCLFNKDIPTAGMIFNLKNNYGWTDQKDLNVSGDLNLKVSKLQDWFINEDSSATDNQA